MRNKKVKIILISIIVMAILSLLTVGCNSTKVVVRREIVIEGSERHQAIIDSLQNQIYDCEEALKAWMVFEEF